MHQNALANTIQKKFPGGRPPDPLYGSGLTTSYLLPLALCACVCVGDHSNNDTRVAEPRKYTKHNHQVA